MRRHHDNSRMTTSLFENPGRPLDRLTSLPDRDHRPYQGADH